MENKKFLLSTLVVVLIIAAGVFFFYNKRHPAKPVVKDIKTQTTTAPKGKVIAGFPTDLAGKTSTVNSSYEIKFENGLDQLSSESTSSFSTIKAAFDYYVGILKAQQYIFFDQSITDSMGHIYAETKDGSADVSITITKVAGKINVASSYLKK